MPKNVSEILEYLRRDELKNINLINTMQVYPVHSAECIGDAVMVRSTTDREWVFISASHQDELKALKSNLTERDTCFAAIEDWMIPILIEDRALKWDLATYRFYLPADIFVPQAEHLTAPLSAADAHTIYDNSEYREFLSIDYILDRIRRGVHCGIRVDDRLVAWGMTQDDGAIGFIHVLESHRRKGCAYSISLALIDAVRKAGRLPFECIEEENASSIKLATKLGFKRDRKIHWFEFK